MVGNIAFLPFVIGLKSVFDSEDFANVTAHSGTPSIFLQAIGDINFGHSMTTMEDCLLLHCNCNNRKVLSR